jgi:tRNA (guanine37-N1)-methyltransferase
MKFSIITLFPDMLSGPLEVSMLKKARDNGLADIEVINLREFGVGSRKQVDDTPYGGGDGMLLKPEPVVNAIEHTKSQQQATDNSMVILLTPQGDSYTQATARQLSEESHIVLVCGHYEGFDERIRAFVDWQISIGDYVLTGGEIPAMAVVDSVTRLLPGVLGGERSAASDSFADGETLEYPQYTRPNQFRGMEVPRVLLSGNHGEIDQWRQSRARQRARG